MALIFEELANSPRERGDESGLSAVREFKCAWEDRYDVVRHFMGTRTPFGPLGIKAFPGFPSCLASSFSIDPLFSDLTPDAASISADVTNSYTGKPVKVTINYTTKQYTSEAPRDDMPTVEPGTFLSYRQRFGYSLLTLKGRTFVWEDNLSGTDPVPEDVVVTKRVSLIEHTLTWHKVTRPPWTAIRELTSTVHGILDGSGDIITSQSRFVGSAPETMLFDGAEADREFEIDADQPSTWRLSYTFIERRIVNVLNVNNVDVTEVYGWNHSYRPHDGVWERLRVRGPGGKRYPYSFGDFNRLFRYES